MNKLDKPGFDSGKYKIIIKNGDGIIIGDKNKGTQLFDNRNK